MNNFNSKPKSIQDKIEPLILPLVTAMGAFGGFPEPPNIFKNIIKNKFVQYFLLFLLIWQGGGGQNWKLSAKVTVIIFILFFIIKIFQSDKKEQFNESKQKFNSVRQIKIMFENNNNSIINFFKLTQSIKFYLNEKNLDGFSFERLNQLIYTPEEYSKFISNIDTTNIILYDVEANEDNFVFPNNIVSTIDKTIFHQLYEIFNENSSNNSYKAFEILCFLIIGRYLKNNNFEINIDQELYSTLYFEVNSLISNNEKSLILINKQNPELNKKINKNIALNLGNTYGLQIPTLEEINQTQPIININQ